MRPNGTAIRAIREARKLSLLRLGLLAGIDKSHLSRLERGLAGAAETKLQNIADALGVPPAAITHEEKT